MSDKRLGQGMIAIGIVMLAVIIVVMGMTRNLPYDDKLDIAWVIAILMALSIALIGIGAYEIASGKKE